MTQNPLALSDMPCRNASFEYGAKSNKSNKSGKRKARGRHPNLLKSDWTQISLKPT